MEKMRDSIDFKHMDIAALFRKLLLPTVLGMIFSALFVITDGIFGLSGNFWLVSFKISYLCLPLFYETRTTPSCHPSGCAYRQL